MNEFVNSSWLRCGKSPVRYVARKVSAACRSSWASRWLFRLPVYLLLILSPGLVAQDSSSAFEVRGVVMDDGGEAVAATALDFWLEQEKLASTTSGESGDFSIAVSPVAPTPESLIHISSEKGSAEFTIAQAMAGDLQLQLQSNSASSGMPVWLRTFFSVILPIVVLAIVILALRNRKLTSAGDGG